MWKKMMTGLLAALAFVALSAFAVPASAAAPTENNGKALVVYFSASGSTQRVAEIIAQEQHAALFEIQPSQPYTDADINYTNDNSRVVREHAQPQLRPAYDGDVADWADYDTIYIGYPLWWAQAPHVVYTFVENHDFSGKTVIPFCTSYSSPLGDSGRNLAKAAGSGNWQTGVRFYSGVSQNEVLNWLRNQ